jgi:hypothetical protein
MEAFQLRLWDGRLGRWMSPDPYGQHSSPYLGMGNNPISAVDPDGGDIIYLNASTSVPVPGGGGYFGHAAVLIGNDHDGWRYLSMNGTAAKGENGWFYGDSRFADLGNIKQQNDFRGTKLTAKEVIQIVNKSNGAIDRHHYDRAVRIRTSGFEDEIAYQAAKKQANSEKYGICGSSCLDVPQAAFEAVVKHRLNTSDLNFFDAGNYGFKMLIPNQYFDNFGIFMRNINSDLGNNPFKIKSDYTITVGPVEEIKN